MLPDIDNPTQLAVLLHVNHKRAAIIKSQLVSIASHMERDDHFYIFNPHQMPKKCTVGESVVGIEKCAYSIDAYCSYYPVIGWEEIFARLCETCYFNDGVRLIVIISDLKEHSEQFNYCKKSVDEYGCHLALLGVGKICPEGFEHIDPNQVGSTILTKLKELNANLKPAI